MKKYILLLLSGLCVFFSCTQQDDKTVTALTERLENLENEVDGFRKSISDMETADSAFRAEIDTINIQLEELRDREEKLKTSTSRDSADVVKLEETVSELQGKVDALESSDSVLKKGLEDLNAFVDSLVLNTYDEIKDSAELKLAAREKFDELSSLISDMQVQLDDVREILEDLDERVSAMEEAIYGILYSVRSVSVVPDMKDGSLKIAEGRDSFIVNLAIYPLSAADSIAAKGLPISFQILSVASDISPVIDSLEITEVRFEEDLLKLTVSGGRLPASVKNKEKRAFGQVVFYAGEKRVASDIFPLSYIVELTDVSFVSSQMTIEPNTNATVSVQLTPQNATDSRITYTSSDMTVAFVSSTGQISALKIGTARIIASSVMNPSICDTCEVTVWPNGALTGKFSVSATQQVVFSRGNLRAVKNKSAASGKEWEEAEFHFAPNQLDVLGHNNVTEYGELADSVDLFGWSSSDGQHPWGITTSDNKEEYGQKFRDWAEKIGTGWKTLSWNEWNYLLNTRPNADSLKKTGVNVSGWENCSVLAPDGYTKEINSSYDADAWDEAEKEGLICILDAYERYGKNVLNHSYIRTPVIDSGYWTENVSHDFHQTSASAAYGFDVRLVYVLP